VTVLRPRHLEIAARLHLSGKRSRSDWSPLVPIRPHGDRAPLFVVDGIGGDVVSFDAQIAWRYASLRATHTIRNADAIQLACAAHFGVDLFITNDKNLHKLNVPGIGFIAPLEKVPL